MARFAKKGSTRTDILEAMFKELKKDGAEYYLGDDTIGNIKAFTDIDPSKHKDLVGVYISAIIGCKDNSATYKDVHKITFEFENCGESDEFYDENIDQYRQLQDGTALIWGYGGGDWEMPVQFALYLDPKNKVRAYVPSDGNVYCHKCKCAIGSCECDDEDTEEQEEYEDDWYPNHLSFEQMYQDVCNRIETK